MHTHARSASSDEPFTGHNVKYSNVDSARPQQCWHAGMVLQSSNYVGTGCCLLPCSYLPADQDTERVLGGSLPEPVTTALGGAPSKEVGEKGKEEGKGGGGGADEGQNERS